MTKLFHISVLFFSMIMIFSFVKFTYAQTGKTNEIKTEINKADEEKFKKIEEENIRINKEKDESVRNAYIILVIIIIFITFIFYYIGYKKKCPSCKKLFSEKVIECIPIKTDSSAISNSNLNYSIKRKCSHCGFQWEKVEEKKKKIKSYDD